jgi:hypothetical protein
MQLQHQGDQVAPAFRRYHRHRPASAPRQRFHARRRQSRGAACAIAGATECRVSDRAILPRRKSNRLDSGSIGHNATGSETTHNRPHWPSDTRVTTLQRNHPTRILRRVASGRSSQIRIGCCTMSPSFNSETRPAASRPSLPIRLRRDCAHSYRSDERHHLSKAVVGRCGVKWLAGFRSCANLDSAFELLAVRPTR